MDSEGETKLMSKYISPITSESLTNLCTEIQINDKIDTKDYSRFGVKRGLRNADGTGVMAGLTKICSVDGYYMDDGERVPRHGKLRFRGLDVNEIVAGCRKEDRFGFEEVAWLLIFGSLPTPEQLNKFRDVLAECRELPEDFIEDMIMKAPSPNIMNKMARSVMALYSYDENPDDISIENVLRQCIQLIAQLPSIMSYAYQVKRRHYYKKSMYIHQPKPELCTAQTILRTLRSDRHFTDEEAKLLDLCLILHSEHGGGNNSTFATRVLTSSGTDTYSATAASIGALKGPRHGGANIKVKEMTTLMGKAKRGGMEARRELIEGNLRLVLSVIQRFNGRGENPDDLFQVGCIGLLKAIANFDETKEVRFSTYGVPMIAGEIRRYLRDNSVLRVSRSLRDLAYRVLQCKEAIINETGREPSLEELSQKLDVPVEDISLALDAVTAPISLYDPVYADGGDPLMVMDQIKDTKNTDEKWLERIALRDAFSTLSQREKQILILRFYDGKTQMEVAGQVGISQAQVSRLEKNAINTMRKQVVV